MSRFAKYQSKERVPRANLIEVPLRCFNISCIGGLGGGGTGDFTMLTPTPPGPVNYHVFFPQRGEAAGRGFVGRVGGRAPIYDLMVRKITTREKM